MQNRLLHFLSSPRARPPPAPLPGARLPGDCFSTLAGHTIHPAGFSLFLELNFFGRPQQPQALPVSPGQKKQSGRERGMGWSPPGSLMFLRHLESPCPSEAKATGARSRSQVRKGSTQGHSVLPEELSRDGALPLNPLPRLPSHPFPVLTAVVGGLIRAWI